MKEEAIPEEDSVVDDEMVARIADWLNAYEKQECRNRVGGFDFVNGSLVTDDVEIELGTVDGEFVIHTADRNYRGDVVYDIVLGGPDIQWLGEEDISAHIAEIKRQFRIIGPYFFDPVKPEKEELQN